MMKRYLVIAVSLLVALIINCTPSVEEQAAAFIKAADAKFNEKNYTEAAVLYNKACNLAPTVECWTALGKTYLADKDADKAITAFGHGLKIAPDDANLLLQIAIAHNSKSRWDKSLAAINMAQQKVGDQGAIYWVLAETYIGLRLYDEAKDAVRIASELGGAEDQVKTTMEIMNKTLSELEPHRALGDSFMTLARPTEDQYNRAYFMYKLILDNNAEDIDAYQKIVKALKGFKEREEAKKYQAAMDEIVTAKQWYDNLPEEQKRAILISGDSYLGAYDKSKNPAAATQ
jgi:hypothetical protein